MSEFEASIRMPPDPRDYRIEAFFDDDTPDDVPDLHIRTGKQSQPLPGGGHYFTTKSQMIVRMDTDWSFDDCREFWARLKAAADKALARMDKVEEAANV